MVIPTARKDLLPHLNSGLGDIAIGNLTITEGRSEQADFSMPLLFNVDEILVTSKDDGSVTLLEELSGKSVYVRQSSSYKEHLLGLNEILCCLSVIREQNGEIVFTGEEIWLDFFTTDIKQA